MISRAIDSRLDWQRRHQDNIFGVRVNQRTEVVDDNAINMHVSDDEAQAADNEARATFLSSSLHGSPRHLK
jgi:hypothetical protein